MLETVKRLVFEFGGEEDLALVMQVISLVHCNSKNIKLREIV